jgi:hypothetical protein
MHEDRSGRELPAKQVLDEQHGQVGGSRHERTCELSSPAAATESD